MFCSDLPTELVTAYLRITEKLIPVEVTVHLSHMLSTSLQHMASEYSA
jgi:hypothetical protein